MKIDLPIDIQQDLVNGVVVAELKNLYEESIGTDFTLQDDIDYEQSLRKCAIFLLKHYTTPKEFKEYMEELDE